MTIKNKIVILLGFILIVLLYIVLPLGYTDQPSISEKGSYHIVNKVDTGDYTIVFSYYSSMDLFRYDLFDRITFLGKTGYHFLKYDSTDLEDIIKFKSNDIINNKLIGKYGLTTNKTGLDPHKIKKVQLGGKDYILWWS